MYKIWLIIFILVKKLIIVAMMIRNIMLRVCVKTVIIGLEEIKNPGSVIMKNSMPVINNCFYKF